MKIELKEISIREVSDNYVDSAEEGVVGYNGKLNIRPKYQREFVYDEKKRNAVISTSDTKGYMLARDEDIEFVKHQILENRSKCVCHKVM